MATAPEKILLGIDTGGTYTDAVLFSDQRKVIAKAKSLTTPHDLAIGISGAIEATLDDFEGTAGDIALVSISTTLATNALVEGKGGSVALVMIGFDAEDMERAGLREALGGDPVLFLPGGHDVNGNERPLDLGKLDDFVQAHKASISGFAVAGYFAVRNSSHEVTVRDRLDELSGMPVTCSHELTSRLGGPKRALTTLLNARLIPVIRNLVQSCRDYLDSAGINAPLMVVRGDGALVNSSFALARPIETILSGPAASLIGAKFLLGTADALVSDIGGTTTDIAILEKGWPRIEPEGASVGGYQTMVEAVAMHTFGLGGDSVVNLAEGSDGTAVTLGPRRQIPISLLAVEHEKVVMETLKRQDSMEFPNDRSARFALLAPNPAAFPASLKATEQKLLAKLTRDPQPFDQLLKGAVELGTLNRLVTRGLAQVCGFTPSDAMHVLGRQNNWNADAAGMAAQILCRVRDRFGDAIARSPEELCNKVKRQLTAQSGDAIISACMREEGIPVGPGAAQLIERTLDRKKGFVNLELSLDRPIVGLGASASVYYPEIGTRLNTDCLVPEHADVANAIGAVAGEVRIQRSRTISSPDGGSSFHLMSDTGPVLFVNEQEAIEQAGSDLVELCSRLALEAGALNPKCEIDVHVDAPEVDGSRHFVEARVTVSATGRPRIP